jgi:hypothetical protein
MFVVILTVVCMLAGMNTNMDPMLLAKFKAEGDAIGSKYD